MEIKVPKQKRPVVAIDRLTGEVTARFGSLTEAAEAYGICASNAWKECDKRIYPKHRFDALRYADDTEPIGFMRSSVRCVVASDGNEVHAWPCIGMAAEDSSLSYDAFVGRIKRGATVELLGREMLARYVDRPLNRNAKVVRHV